MSFFCTTMKESGFGVKFGGRGFMMCGCLSGDGLSGSERNP